MKQFDLDEYFKDPWKKVVTRDGRRRKIDGTKKIEKRKPSKEFSRRNNWWYIPPQKGKEHPAVFPEQLANDHIISWSNEGNTVLDCFMGSGTTGKMAVLNNRKFIGIELDNTYFEIAKERINKAVENTKSNL